MGLMPGSLCSARAVDVPPNSPENIMAKGQARSNREAKKPKQDKKAAPAAPSSFSSVAPKAAPPSPAKKK